MTNAAPAASARPPRGLSYNQVRILMLVCGLVLLGLTAGVNYVRRVETAEVAAILFFIPIFVAFVAFGAIGGLANQQLRSSLTKLDLYDQIDDDTGLFNARYFLQDTDLEMSRARRYQTIFSVTVVDVPAEALDSMGRRRRRAALRQLGRLLADS